MTNEPERVYKRALSTIAHQRKLSLAKQSKLLDAGNTDGAIREAKRNVWLAKKEIELKSAGVAAYVMPEGKSLSDYFDKPIAGESQG